MGFGSSGDIHIQWARQSNGVAMDKPRHPIVTRPWKTQQTQSTRWNLPPLKTEKGRGRPDSKGPGVVTSKKNRRRASGKTT